MYLKEILLIVFTTFLVLSLTAQDTHWRGQNRDGHYHQEGLMKMWPDPGPQKILSAEGIGRGFSSIIVANHTLYTTGMIDTLDYLSAIDFDGNIQWQVPYGLSWQKSYPDTRSTPTIEGDLIYVVSGTGELVCLDAGDGSKVWSVNVDKDFNAAWGRWGVAESPLIVDDKVICTPGGDETTVVALNKHTGELVWKTKSLSADRSYVSPVLFEYEDLRFILAMTGEDLVAVDPQTGAISWVYKYFKPDWSERSSLILVNTPIFKNDEIFISMGYNYPSVMLKLDPTGTSVQEKWVNHTLDTHHGGFVQVGGFIYGSNWKSNRQGNWVCLDWETGEVKYEEEWHNKGSVIFADGMLYCYEEKSGHVALVKPNPDRFEVVSSFKVDEGSGPHWAHPTIYDGKLFIRHGDVLMIYSILETG